MNSVLFGRDKKLKSFSFSLFIFYSAGLLITMVLVTGFFSIQYKKAYSEMTSNYNSAIIKHLTSEIDFYLQQVEELSSYPYIYTEWREQMKNRIHHPYEDIDILNMVNLEEFDSTRSQMANSTVDYYGVYLFCENGQLLYNSSNLPNQYILDYYRSQSYKDTKWYKQTVNGDGKAVFLHHDQVNNSLKNAFYVTRLVKDTVSRKELGVYMMAVNINGLASLCESYIDTINERCLVFNQDGRIIFSVGNEFNLPENFYKSLSSKQKELIFTANDTKYLATYDISPKYGWTTVRFIPLSISQQSRRVTVITMVMFIVCCTLFAFTVFFVLSKQLTKPIEQLKNGMKQVELGNYSIYLKHYIRNELSDLFSSFNSMTSQIKCLVEKVLAEEMKKKEAQFIALQRQINPHFLYNTLDSIQLVAISNRDYQASRMITSLAKLLRYAISDDDNVSLRDELLYIDDYVSLQQIRFKNSFSLYKSIPEEFLDKPLIRLSLQPIIENSIQHGLRGVTGGTIVLSAYSIENGYEIVIKDNGKGMSNEQLSEIRHKLCEHSSGYNSIGIYNVNFRLITVFGEGSGLFIDSSIGSGTAVTMRVICER